MDIRRYKRNLDSKGLLRVTRSDVTLWEIRGSQLVRSKGKRGLARTQFAVVSGFV